MTKRPITPTVRIIRRLNRATGHTFFDRAWMGTDHVRDYRTITHNGEVYLYRHVIRHPHSFAVWHFDPTDASLDYCPKDHAGWEACWKRHTYLLERGL
jgi:hypothetical protein